MARSFSCLREPVRPTLRPTPTFGASHGPEQIAGYTGAWNQGRSILRGDTRTETAYRYPDLRWVSGGLAPHGGLSGSPLFFNAGGRWRVVGLYTSGDMFGIGGMKLTPQIRGEMQGWINRNP